MTPGMRRVGGHVVVSDSHPIVVIEADPATVEFLLRYLPRDDGFTSFLQRARDEAVKVLWERASGG